MTRLPEVEAGRTSVRARWCLALVVAGYFVVAVMAGAPNSPLTTPLPIGARPPTWAAHLAKMFGLQHAGRPAIIVASLLVVTAVLSAFVLLLLEAIANRVRLSIVLVAVGVSLTISVAAPLLLSRDVFSYAAYARIYALHHQNPYVFVPASFPHDAFVVVTSRQWLPTRSLYGPFFTLASAAIVRIWSGSPGAAILAFKVLAGAGIAAATVCTALAARAVRPQRAALAAAIVGLNPVLVIHTVGGGHVDALIAALLAGALALAVRAPTGDIGKNPLPTTVRSASVTTLLTLAVAIKAVIVPALLLWLWWTLRAAPREGRWRTAVIHLALVGGLLAALFAPFAAGWHTFTPVATLGGVEGWASPAHLVARGTQAVIGSVAGSAAGAAAGWAVLGAFLLAFAALVWRTGLRRADLNSGLRFAPISPIAGWGSALLLLALAVPYLLPWYAAWFVPFLGLMADNALMWIGVAVSGLLALTLIPADPPHGMSTWGVMLGVHYVVAPLMLGLLLAAASRVVADGTGRRPQWHG